MPRPHACAWPSGRRCYKAPMKLVIFDCDGTLIDSQHNIRAAMAYAFETHGLDVPSRDAVLGVVGLSLPETFTVLAPDKPREVQLSLAAHYRDAFLTGPLRERQEEPLYDGIADTIAALAGRPDRLLGVATGKSRRGVKRLFDREQWHAHFATIQTADDHPSKPDPSMILRAMEETGAEPADTVMVGDTAYDIEMARNAGVGAIGVGWGYHATARLRSAGAHALVTDGVDLLAAIEARLKVQEDGR